MAAAAKETLQRDDLHAIADKRYFNGSQILACHQAGITTIVPRPETSGNRSKGMYMKADFGHDSGHDVYVCPAGEELSYCYTRERLGRQADPMTLRRCTVEHPFGTLKAWIGNTHFLTRS